MAMDFIADKAKSAAKKMGKRGAEKLIRKMGGGETRDRQFDDLEYSFQQQVGQSEKLRKEMKKYLDMIKETRKALKNVNDVIADFYDDNWPRCEEFQICLQDQETLWSNFERQIQNLRDPIRRYELQFTDIQERSERRKNKLLDYDYARRALEKVYNDHKSSDEKIEEAEDEFDDREQDYQEVNQDLLQDMPRVLQSRIGFMVEAFGNFIAAHESFCSESFKVQNVMGDIVRSMPNQNLQISIGRPSRGRNRLDSGGGNFRSQGQGMRDTRAGGAYVQGPGQRGFATGPTVIGQGQVMTAIPGLQAGVPGPGPQMVGGPQQGINPQHRMLQGQYEGRQGPDVNAPRMPGAPMAPVLPFGVRGPNPQSVFTPQTNQTGGQVRPTGHGHLQGPQFPLGQSQPTSGHHTQSHNIPQGQGPQMQQGQGPQMQQGLGQQMQQGLIQQMQQSLGQQMQQGKGPQMQQGPGSQMQPDQQMQQGQGPQMQQGVSPLLHQGPGPRMQLPFNPAFQSMQGQATHDQGSPTPSTEETK